MVQRSVRRDCPCSPESCSSTESFALAAGSKQSVVSTGASRVLEVICNLVDGEEGRAVRRVERSTLDNEDPDWMAGTKTKLCSDTVRVLLIHARSSFTRLLTALVAC